MFVFLGGGDDSGIFVGKKCSKERYFEQDHKLKGLIQNVSKFCPISNIFPILDSSALGKKASGKQTDIKAAPGNNRDEYKLDYVIKPEEVEKIGLCGSPGFLARIQQLADLCSTQSCVIVCGPAGCGKSSIIKSLARSVECSGNRVSLDRLVFGTLETEELFGYFTPSK